MPVSITQLAAGTPWWIYAIVIAALALHIGGGLVAIVSGYGALGVRKGGASHLRLGKIFVTAMLVMGAMGTALSISIHQPANIGGGLLSAYLAVTGWLTIKRKPDEPAGQIEKAAVLVPLLLSILFVIWGTRAGRDGGGYYGFAVISALLVAADVRTHWRGSMSRVQQLTRHLWRMCTGLFFATGSFFLGQQKVMPEFIHGSPVLWILALAPLGFMVFWLIRVRRTGRRGQQVPAAAPEALLPARALP
jgi:hypothetical protein